MTNTRRGCLVDRSTTSGSKPKRSISFDESRNDVRLYDAPSGDLQELLFFSGDDFMLMKAKSREEARSWRRQGFSILLKQSFEAKHPKAQDYLSAFAQLEDDLYRRGLERHLSRHHAEERSDRKDCARQSVFMNQGKLRRQGATQEDLARKISEAYKDHCRNAKVFARRIAIADELVVLKGEDSSFAEKIVEESEVPSRGRKVERRLSACSLMSASSAGSNYSAMSSGSFDSLARRRMQGQGMYIPRYNKGSKGCPSSPATPLEEYFAAVA